MIKVVKIGGNVVDNPQLLENFIKDFTSMEGPKVLIHGGGVMASQMQRQLGQQPVMIEGRRVTDQDTLKIVTMIYAGWCSKSIVAIMQKHGCSAIGLSGADADLITAVRRPPVTAVSGETIDYGYVGDVDPSMINSGFIISLTGQGITPVICAITSDGHGNLLNTNADTMAGTVARGLAGRFDVSLVYCFEKPGVLRDENDDTSVISVIDRNSFDILRADGIVTGGMIPKIENALAAIDEGVAEVVITAHDAIGGGTRIVR